MNPVRNLIANILFPYRIEILIRALHDLKRIYDF